MSPLLLPLSQLLILLFLFLLLPLASPKVTNATFDTLSSFEFVDRFVFYPTPESEKPPDYNSEKSMELYDYGLVNFEIEYAEGLKPELLLYYNGFDSYNKMVTENTMSCIERRKLASAKIDLSKMGIIVKDVERIKFSDRETVRVNGYTYFTSKFPQWFFVVISNCFEPASMSEDEGDQLTEQEMRCKNKGYCQGPILAKVNLVMTNGNSISSKHFSYDEIGIRELYITYFSFSCCVMIWLQFVRNALTTLNKWHFTVRILSSSIILNFACLLFNMLHYVTFAEDGVGLTWCSRVGSILAAVSDLLVVYLLIFLAKGWTLVRYKISSGGRLKIAIIITLTFFSSMSMEAWKFYGYDAETIVNQWVSGPGITYLYIHIFITVWFLYCCQTTIRAFETKTRFYKRFSAGFGFWLFLKPIIILLCEVTLTDDNRAVFLTSWEVTLRFLGQLLLLGMYDPRYPRLNAGFPFHSVTSVMLGLVHGETPKDFIEKQLSEKRIRDLGLGPRGAGPPQTATAATATTAAKADEGTSHLPSSATNPLSLPIARSVIKQAGSDISSSLLRLSSLGSRLRDVLVDLDDFDEEDVSFGESVDRGMDRENERIMRENKGRRQGEPKVGGRQMQMQPIIEAD